MELYSLAYRVAVAAGSGLAGQPRIVFCLPGFDVEHPVTGGEQVNARLIQATCAAGLDVRLIDGHEFGPRWRLGMIGGRLLGNVVLAPAIVASRADWLVTDSSLHTHVLLPVLVRKLVRRRSRTVVLANHLTHPLRRAKIMRWIERWTETALLRSATIVVAISEATAAAVRSLDVRPDAIRVVAPLTETIEVGPVVRRPPRVAGEPLRLLCVGTVYERKGVLDLVDALAMLDSTVTAVVIGGLQDQSYVSRVRRRISDLGVADRVVLRGRVDADELAAAYAAADVFVFPSLMEGYGIALVEAMVHALPIVATRVGAVPELVREGVDGLLVEPGDSAGLAQALRTFLENPDLTARCSANSHARGAELAARPLHAVAVLDLIAGAASGADTVAQG